jgi:hypothetical protein
LVPEQNGHPPLSAIHVDWSMRFGCRFLSY